MLTDKALRAIKPRERPYKRADEKGLYAIVRPDGGIWWRLKYRHGGREKLISLGTYPDVSLKRAREKRDEARALLDRGIDPSAKRKAEKVAHADSFRAVAEEFLGKKSAAASTIAILRRRLERFVYPHIGNDPVRAIAAEDLLRVLRRIESQGKHETAHRIRALCSEVFRYAIPTGRADRDPAADLRGALTTATVKHFAAITDPKALGGLLRSIDAYGGQPATVAALKLLALTFVRPGELRLATWQEFDLEGAQWSIPAERTKMRREHVVPLASQAVAILEELRRLTDRGPTTWVFPSLRPTRPLSENTINYALRNMGIGPDIHVAHGFRSTASTLLHELGFVPEVIETQLAHARPGVAGIYNRSHLLADRRRMMQTWADYLDRLKAGATVTAIRGAG